MWGKQDSNLRSHKTADLQSAPVGRFGISPNHFLLKVVANLRAIFVLSNIWSFFLKKILQICFIYLAKVVFKLFFPEKNLHRYALKIKMLPDLVL